MKMLTLFVTLCLSAMALAVDPVDANRTLSFEMSEEEIPWQGVRGTGLSRDDSCVGRRRCNCKERLRTSGSFYPALALGTREATSGPSSSHETYLNNKRYF